MRTSTGAGELPHWARAGLAVALLAWAAMQVVDFIGDATEYRKAADPQWDQWIANRVGALAQFAVGIGLLWIAVDSSRAATGLRVGFAVVGAFVLAQFRLNLIY